ncbi:MAG: phosphatidate cytidylyltransferase [Gammaproteobacteria bacterium RIFCSPLOWO2_02_FULL_56_15]|nr:MAG: phosphatidate cytidylyltransferase [Gammaproteobacteria bacterium RIFCSPLOWO2_02_FULL_56_15]
MNAYFPPGLLPVLAGNFSVLVIATGIIRGLRNHLSNMGYTELVQRVRSWWIIFGIFTFAIVTDKVLFLLLMTLISYLAFKEFVSMVPVRRADRKLLLLLYLSIPIQYTWIWFQWYGMFLVFIPVVLFLLLQVGMILGRETRGYLRAGATLYWGMMISVFSLSHLGYLMVLPQEQGTHAYGACLVIYIVLLTQINDVAQYLWGKTLGHTKIIPEISPNKTWAGFLGGIFTTSAISMVISPALTPFGTITALIAGLLIGITGFFGDLSISAIKRELCMKNTGDLIPGHGGILDRVDSLTFTAPLFFHCFYLYTFISG